MPRMPHKLPMSLNDNFNSLFEFLAIGAYRSSPDGRQLRANPALVRLNGFASEAEQIAIVSDIAGEWYVDPARRAQFMQQIDTHSRVVGLESEIYRHETRERIWISENAHAVRDASGAVAYYEGTVEDITDRVREREALARSREQLRQIIELVPGMVYRVELMPDHTRRATFVSSRVQELLGIAAEAARADIRIIDRMVHPDDAARVAAQAKLAGAERRPLQGEFRVLMPDGQTRWLQAFSEPAQSEDGREVRVGLMMDITDRKRSEEALRENSAVWMRALESTGDGVWDWDLLEGREQLSDQGLALYGFAPGELPLVPEALDQRTHPDDVAQMLRDRQAHMGGQVPAYINEHRIQCKDGRWKWVLSRGVVISRAANGTPLRMIGTHTDITTRKLADQLRLERDRAAAADRAKSQFLSRVSHELRTPLNAILGFSQLLELEDTLDERQRGWLAQVLVSGRHLLGLMDDILDLSSAQTGQLSINTEPLALLPVLAEVWAMLGATAASAGVQTIDELPAGTGALAVQADRKRLKQVLANVIGNAIKYNHRGGFVRVSALALDDVVLVLVADNGIGLSAEQRERLFQPFERLGAQRGEVPGTGLGLALSRQLSEAMGGSIGVESTPGLGSVFTIRLPRA